MSAWKRLLLVLAVVAAVGATVSVALSVHLMLGAQGSPLLGGFVLGLFFLSLALWFPTVYLMVEYTKVARARKGWFKRTASLGWREMRELTAACPTVVKLTALLTCAFGIVQVLRIGDAYPSSGQVFTVMELLGFLGGATVFFSFGVPVLLAAALMNGTYDELFHA